MLREDDFESYARNFSEPEVTRYLGDGKPLDRREAWRSMAFHVGHWALRGYGMWAVEEKASGRLVGRALAYAFTELGREHVISMIRPENVPSIKVAERIGERLESRSELFGREVLIYGIDRRTWRALRA